MSNESREEPQGGAAEAPRSCSTISIEQSSDLSGILPITLLNALLNIITLSLWRFWGRTRVRRYLWSTTRINSIPLEYTGTGFELFRSFLFVMFVIFLPIYVTIFAGQLLLPPEQFMLYFGIAYIPILLLFSWLLGAAVWIARRYRFSRTSWRGIRFVQIGSMSGFAWATIGYSLLSAITLGWFEPVKEMRLTKRLWRETWFGDQKFTVPASNQNLAGPLYGAYALYWFAGLLGYFVFIGIYMAVIWPILEANGGQVPMTASLEMIAGIYLGAFAGLLVWGLLGIPYQVALLRRKAEMVGLGELRFRIDATSVGYFGIVAGNALIIIFTFGLGLPIAQMRLWRYILRKLDVTGEMDLDAVQQNPNKGPGSGEGLADAFDIGNVI